jgi:hypothetical protein
MTTIIVTQHQKKPREADDGSDMQLRWTAAKYFGENFFLSAIL